MDLIIDDIACMLKIPRWQLHIVSPNWMLKKNKTSLSLPPYIIVAMKMQVAAVTEASI